MLAHCLFVYLVNRTVFVNAVIDTCAPTSSASAKAV